MQEYEEGDGIVMSCLQDHRNTLIESKCRDAVHKAIARASEDIRFNQMLSEHCLRDRELHCNTTQQVTLVQLLSFHLKKKPNLC